MVTTSDPSSYCVWCAGPSSDCVGDHKPRKQAERQATGRLRPCPGEAHKNPFIDHCGICAPGWGQIEERLPIDLEAARKERLDVSCGDLTDAQMAEVEKLVRGGAARFLDVTAKRDYGSVNYVVVRWL